MLKPQGYDQAQAATGEYEILPAGGHICIIKQANIGKTKESQKDVLIILFDIAEGEHKDFYKRNFERRAMENSEAKWQGIYRQLTEGKSLPFFKGMIDAIEKSNSPYKWNWDETSLKGKVFGGVFGEEEYEGNDGKVHTSVKCRFVRTVETVKSGKFSMPDKKLLSGSSKQSGFALIDEENSDDLPF